MSYQRKTNKNWWAKYHKSFNEVLVIFLKNIISMKQLHKKVKNYI